MENAFERVEWLVTPFFLSNTNEKVSIGTANKKKPTKRSKKKINGNNCSTPSKIGWLLILRRRFKLLKPIESQLKAEEYKKQISTHTRTKEEDFAWKVNCK